MNVTVDTYCVTSRINECVEVYSVECITVNVCYLSAAVLKCTIGQNISYETVVVVQRYIQEINVVKLC